MNNLPKRADDILNFQINGFHQYIFDETAHLCFLSENFVKMTGYSEDELLDESRDLYSSLVHPDDLIAYSSLLKKVSAFENTAKAKYHLIKKDGSIIFVLDTITSVKDENNTMILSSFLTEIPESEESTVRSLNESSRYLKALSEVYEKIFEFNSLNNTVKCLYCNNSSMFKHFENISMPLDEALAKFITESVDKNDSETVRVFFEDFSEKKFFEPDAKPPTITYKAISSDNVLRQYNGVFIKVTESIGYFCVRRTHESSEVSDLKNENLQLKEKMNDLIMKFSDGIAAFEVTPEEYMKPLYASENVCEFFGYTNEEWIPLTKQFTPWKTFVAKSEASNEDFLNFLKNGEAEFTYFDYKEECEKKIRAVCTQKDMYTNSPRYVVLYSVDDDKRNKKEIPENRNVTIRTFGYFDVFVGDKPIAFRNKKSKELLALLVDRRGGFVTSEEAIGFLWEDEPASTLTLSRYRKVALRLKNTLEEYGVSDIVESIDGKRRIVTEKVKCDLFDYLSGKEEYAKDFKGSYLNNYSWAETTLGELLNS